MNKFLPAIARVFIAQIFLVSILISLNGIMNTPDGYIAYQNGLMSHGLPGIFAPISVIVQLLGGLALFVGFKTRLTALVLTIYTLINALSYLYTFTIACSCLSHTASTSASVFSNYRWLDCFNAKSCHHICT